MRKSDAIRIIYQAAKIYDEQLCNKRLLVIYGAPNIPNYIETFAFPSNFLHLTGVKLNNNNSADRFYRYACDERLRESDFEFKDNTTEQKLNVLIQTLRISTNAKMIGDFINGHLKLQTDKLAGSVNSCLGFIKSNNYYVPNTVLEVDIRQETSDRQKVLAILSKRIEEEKYNTIEMVGKKIDIERLIEKVAQYVQIDSKIMCNNERNLSQSSPQISSQDNALKKANEIYSDFLKNRTDGITLPTSLDTAENRGIVSQYIVGQLNSGEITEAQRESLKSLRGAIREAEEPLFPQKVDTIAEWAKDVIEKAEEQDKENDEQERNDNAR
ncbi:MAG: PBECR4 domain-containing protein [Ruminococcus sp.]|nr:PBECR4 domain-containing protein [Ruminococcus sp.]